MSTYEYDVNRKISLQRNTATKHSMKGRLRQLINESRKKLLDGVIYIFSLKLLEPVWLRSGVHVSYGQILQAVWLINKRFVTVHGSHEILRLKRKKKESSQELLPARYKKRTVLHCSVNSGCMPPLFTEQVFFFLNQCS